MSNNKKQSEIRKKINKIYEENELANLVANKSRARSVTVGTAFGGAVELSMRGDYANLWAILQPVEVVELVEQLAAGIGLQIAIRPRQDFATWRGWNTDAADRYWAGIGNWQIQQAEINHKKTLMEMQENLKLPESRSKKRKRRTIEDLERKKVKKENEIQDKISSEIHKQSSESIEKLREQIRQDLSDHVVENQESNDEKSEFLF